MASKFDPTYPHDYRVLFSGPQLPIIAGGQAVNLWALHYLGPNDPTLNPAQLSSHDLDILADKVVLDFLKTVPGWVYKGRDFRNFADSRQGFFFSTSADGRRLLVEVLHTVHGLVPADLKHSTVLQFDGSSYRLLDPVAMFKSKASNVADIKQDGDSPRHDREHLQLIARCVPLYLRELHAEAVRGTLTERLVVSALSRAFKVLQQPKLAKALAVESIAPTAVIPNEFHASPFEGVRRALSFQMKIAHVAALKSNSRITL